MDGLHVSEANLIVYVHPSKNKKIHQAMLRNLSSLLFQFNEMFEGIVLAYDFNILDNFTKVLPGIFPYLGVKLKANLLVFSPKQDMCIEGKVVKITPESIHVIFLGFSSAIIVVEDIRKDLKYETRKGEEGFVSRLNKRHVIKVGTMIRFSVKSFDEAVLHISGSLMPDNTGSIRWLDRISEDSVQTGRFLINPQSILLMAGVAHETSILEGKMLKKLDRLEGKNWSQKEFDCLCVVGIGKCLLGFPGVVYLRVLTLLYGMRDFTWILIVRRELASRTAMYV